MTWRLPRASSVVSTLPGPLMNWCSLNAKGGLPWGVRTSWAATRKRCRAVRAASGWQPASSARRRLASSNIMGLARLGGSSAGSSIPRFNSTQMDNGSLRKASKSAQISCFRVMAAGSSVRMTLTSLSGLVTRSKVSPMTSCSLIRVPKSLLATSATTRLRSAWLPVLDMVADVPMQTSCSAFKRSRRRRTSKATSAP